MISLLHLSSCDFGYDDEDDYLNKEKLEKLPASISHNVKIVIYDKEGEENAIIYGDKAEFEDSALIDNMKVLFKSEEDGEIKYSELVSDYGKINLGSSIEAWGNVVLIKKNEFRLETEKIYWNKGNYKDYLEKEEKEKNAEMMRDNDNKEQNVENIEEDEEVKDVKSNEKKDTKIDTKMGINNKLSKIDISNSKTTTKTNKTNDNNKKDTVGGILRTEKEKPVVIYYADGTVIRGKNGLWFQETNTLILEDTYTEADTESNPDSLFMSGEEKSSSKSSEKSSKTNTKNNNTTMKETIEKQAESKEIESKIESISKGKIEEKEIENEIKKETNNITKEEIKEKTKTLTNPKTEEKIKETIKDKGSSMINQNESKIKSKIEEVENKIESTNSRIPTPTLRKPSDEEKEKEEKEE